MKIVIKFNATISNNSSINLINENILISLYKYHIKKFHCQLRQLLVTIILSENYTNRNNNMFYSN